MAGQCVKLVVVVGRVMATKRSTLVVVARIAVSVTVGVDVLGHLG